MNADHWQRGNGIACIPEFMMFMAMEMGFVTVTGW